MRFRHFNDFAKILTIGGLFFVTTIFQLKEAKLGGPTLESSMHFRNSRKHLRRCASFGAVDYDFGKKAIFVRLRRYFRKGSLRRFYIVRAKIAVLRQKLPFWDESCHFQDINCRLGDEMPFSR